jgi:hypothetical protein
MLWLVLGDFNEITALEEKFGRDDRNLHQMVAFCDALTDCTLLDLGFIGPLFTWTNCRVNGDLVRVRLDRELLTRSGRCVSLTLLFVTL